MEIEAGQGVSKFCNTTHAIHDPDGGGGLLRRRPALATVVFASYPPPFA